MKASIDTKMKLNGKNKTTAINAWGVAAFRYGAAQYYSGKSVN